MKLITFLTILLLPILASAGAYEDMEEAIIQGDAPDAIALIKRGMDGNTVDREGNTLLFQAVRRDIPELVDYLIRHRARLNVRNRNGETAVSIAAFKGNLSYVKLLVDAGADVNLYGWSPLIYAAYNGHAQIVDYLLRRGARIDATTENGSSALFFAARFGHIEVVELLLKNKADPMIANENGDTAVDWALKSENTDIADLLRAAGGRSGKAVVLELSK